jgi:hypothetical protein
MTLTWETTTAAARDCEVQPDDAAARHAPTGSPRRPLRSAGAGSTDKGSLLQQWSTSQRRPAARSIVEFHGKFVIVREGQAPRSEHDGAVGEPVVVGAAFACCARCRATDLLRVPFSWGARRGVMGTVRLFGGEFRLPTVVSCRTVRSD